MLAFNGKGRQAQQLCQVALGRADGRTKLPDQFGLTRGAHFAVAVERRHDVLVAKVLAPRFEFLGCPANLLAKLCKRVAEAVRVEIGQARVFEGVPEYAAYSVGRGPVFACQSGDTEALLSWRLRRHLAGFRNQPVVIDRRVVDLLDAYVDVLAIIYVASVDVAVHVDA